MRRFFILSALFILAITALPLFAQTADKPEEATGPGKFVITNATFDAFSQTRGAILVTVKNENYREGAAKITVKRTARECVKGDAEFCKGKPAPCEPPCKEWQTMELGLDSATLANVKGGEEVIVNIPVDNLSCDAEIKVSPGEGTPLKLKIEAKEVK